jgi:hypothetical protein
VVTATAETYGSFVDWSGSSTLTLSSEDTEDDAIARVLAGPGGTWSDYGVGMSEWELRTTGSSFRYYQARFRVVKSGLVPNHSYSAKVSLSRYNYRTGVNDPTWKTVIVSGTSDASGMLTTAMYDMPLERGYSIRAESACVLINVELDDSWDRHEQYTPSGADCGLAPAVDGSTRKLNDVIQPGGPSEADYAGLVIETLAPTERTITGTDACVGGSSRAVGSVVDRLSNEDTEDAALARAPISIGTSSIAYRTSRGAGQYAFSFCSVTAKISAANLCPGDYDLVITYGERSEQGGDWSTRVETQKVTVTDGDFSVEKKIPFGESGTEKTILSARLFSLSHNTL